MLRSKKTQLLPNFYAALNLVQDKLKLSSMLFIAVTNHFIYRLELKTLTCDKLSHCLFDFDCVDLNVYERETYNYQEFSIDKVGSDQVEKETNVTNDSKITLLELFL